MPVEEEIRDIIRESEQSRYAISRETGIAESQLSRFLNGQSLRAETLEILAGHFGYEVLLRRKRPS
ncbi:MAG: helix-turn-helix transcriptional regulator [Planctomycetaceae bacterium]